MHRSIDDPETLKPWSTTELRFKSGLTAARNPTTKANWCGQFKMSAAAADEVSGNPTIRTV